MLPPLQLRGACVRVGLGALLVGGGADALGAQGPELAPTKSVRAGRTLVVAEQSSPISRSQLKDVLKIVDERRAELLGFPDGILDSLQITVSFASSPMPSRDAWSSADAGLIVLPDTKALRWVRGRLERTIVHELAHMALAAAVPSADSLPLWLHEGLAEWSAGGLTCEAEARIRLAFDRGRSAEELASLNPAGVPDILNYDMFGLFFAHADRRTGGAISDGSFLEALNPVDVNAAFLQIAGIGVDSLQAEWRHELKMNFGDGLAGLSCRGAT